MSSEDGMNIREERQDGPPPNATKGRVPKKTKASSPGPSNVPKESQKPSSKRAPATHVNSDHDSDDLARTLGEPAKRGPKPKPRSKTATDHKLKGQETTINSRPKPPKRVQVSEDEMEVDREDSGVNAATNPSSIAATSKIDSSSDVKDRKELDRWKQKAKALELQRDTLSKQLEELFQIRRTEPEQVLEQLQLQYEERAKTQDALIKELRSQLARIEPLSRTGQAVALHFLTREAADEEKRVVEQDITRLQEVIKEKDSMIDEKTRRIAELEQSVQDAIRERDAEIERSKELLARAAPKGIANSRPTNRPLGVDDPKTTAVIKFYEDVSNVLVTSVKFENTTDSEPDVIFHCIYTYFEVTDQVAGIEPERINEKSIVFTLRIFNGFGGPNGEAASDDDFIHRRIRYAPLHLDKEPESFVKGLEYMAESFTFPCGQQGLFFESLREKIRNAAKDVTEYGSEVTDDSQQ